MEILNANDFFNKKGLTGYVDTKAIEEYAKYYSTIKNKDLIERCYNLAKTKVELEGLVRQSIDEINHLKHEYKDTGHCGRYLRNAEILLDALTPTKQNN